MKWLKLVKSTLKTSIETSFETISKHLHLIQDNVKEIFREVMFSTYLSHRESVCRSLEKAAKNVGIGSFEEFKYTSDEPIAPKVYGKIYEFCIMDVQSTSNITKLQEDIKTLRKQFQEDTKAVREKFQKDTKAAEKQLDKEKEVSLLPSRELWLTCPSFLRVWRNSNF